MPRRAVVALTLLLVAACSSTSATERAPNARASQARDLAKRAGLTKPVQDLLAEYAASVAQPFSATYDVVGASRRLVIDNDPPRRRVAQVATAGGTEAEADTFVLGSRSYLCKQQAGQWSCTRTAAPAPVATAFDSDTVDRTVSALVDARSNYDYKVTPRRVIDVDATCLVATPTGPAATAATLCLSAEGVPLVIQTPSLSLQVVRYSRHVDTARFRLPAPPTNS